MLIGSTLETVVRCRLVSIIIVFVIFTYVLTVSAIVITLLSIITKSCAVIPFCFIHSFS